MFYLVLNHFIKLILIYYAFYCNTKFIVMVEYNKLFIINLKKFMTDQKMSQARLAKESGISKSTITLIFKGTYNPSLSMMSKIAETLNVPLSIFFNEDMLASEFKDKETVKGFERVVAILPKSKAFIVRRWHEFAVKHIYGKKAEPFDIELEFDKLMNDEPSTDASSESSSNNEISNESQEPTNA